MRVIQLLPTLGYGDAIGNNVIALCKTLKKAGYRTEIYAENIDTRLGVGIAEYTAKLNKVHKDDIIIYHLATGSDLNYRFAEFKCRKIVIYHNITPWHFFDRYNYEAGRVCRYGVEDMKYLADKVDYCIAVSEYNKKDLIEAGYKCRIDVLPILIPFDDYASEPDRKVIDKYGGDGYVNILFTGRIVPNKKQEDVIAAFCMYKRYYNNKARLFIVGSYEGMETYYYKLQTFCETIGVEDVIFTGHISFKEILAYYNLADLFLCMSEHEGFCVPLVEAMYFNIPIIAYDSSAIADTLGGAGVLLDRKEPLETAGMMDYIINNLTFKSEVIWNQKKRLEYFEHDRIEKMFLKYVDDFIEQK